MEGVIGEIIMFAGNFAPKQWAFCMGQTISIASNTALFSILGTTYGGNGTTTFMLPNFQSRMPVGAGSGPGLASYSLGQMGGTETITLNSAQMPQHSHTVTLNCSSEKATLTTPVGNFPAVTEENPGYISSNNIHMGTFSTGNTGSGQPFYIIPPVLGINFVICQFGVYPARN